MLKSGRPTNLFPVGELMKNLLRKVKTSTQGVFPRPHAHRAPIAASKANKLALGKFSKIRMREGLYAPV
jgi:hypothetical protein